MGRRRRRNRHPKKYCTTSFLECKAMDKTGKGIVYFKDKPFFIDELITGESAIILVYYEEDDFGIGRAIKIKKESPNRKLPLGHWKFSIGSYHIPHLTDEAQDEFKQKRVNDLFGNSLPIKVGKRTFYRNKVSLSNGGFMPPGRGRRFSVVPEDFDLMKIDFSKYKDSEGVHIIRELDTKIEGKPGDKVYTTDEVFNKKFRISLDSFYQVNSEMAKLAYEEILSFIPEDAIVFDLFSGAGTIGIIASIKAKEVYCVEINKNSHNDAVYNVKLNNLKNVYPILGDANEFVKKSKIRPNIIVVDPARAGLSSDSCAAINNSGAETIVYLSCNIDTQKRDVDLMTNYQIKHLQPYDFFPQTFHIENLIVLTKK